MQLNNAYSRGQSSPVRRALTLATATLLAGPVAAGENGFELQLSQLYYAEKDRVRVNTSQISLNKTLTESDVIKLGFTYDAMTGASPNGRIVPTTTQSQTVPITTASGFTFSAQSGRSSGSGNTWLTTFEDNRSAGSLDWEHTISRNIATRVGANVSSELDYRSLGGSAVLNVDLNDKRTTVSAGSSLNQDTIDPRGGIPDGLGLIKCADNTNAFQPQWISCDAQQKRYKAGDKISTSFFIGVTQVWNQKTLAQVNFTHAINDGYLTDPYKQLSLINNNFAGEVAVVYEKRPDRRRSDSLFIKAVHTLGDRSINASYRYFWDDWNVRAHTVDVHTRFDINSMWFLQPHVRYSKQTAAEFFTTSLNTTNTKPTYASADHRLGSQTAITYGIKAGVTLSKLAKLGLRVERMVQRYDSNTLPNLEAWIVQLTFQNDF